jgi:hypothetical protein
MKKILIPVFILLIACSCSPAQKTASAPGKPSIISDSTEYEITIIDNAFDNWYLLNYTPSKDYSNEYYRAKNQIGVGNWNNYFNKGKYHEVIENHIYFDYSVDYGIDVNRKLFWYFKFIEENYRIRLLK